MIEDLDQDLKRGRFNPILEIYRGDSGDSVSILNESKDDLIYLSHELACDLAISLDNLPLKRNHELIRGIYGRSVEYRFSKLLQKDPESTCQARKVYA